MVVTPADHVIEPAQEFRRAIQAAEQMVREHSQALVTFGFLTEEPLTATDLLARPIWNILSDRGTTVGVIDCSRSSPSTSR